MQVWVSFFYCIILAVLDFLSEHAVMRYQARGQHRVSFCNIFRKRVQQVLCCRVGRSSFCSYMQIRVSLCSAKRRVIKMFAYMNYFWQASHITTLSASLRFITTRLRNSQFLLLYCRVLPTCKTFLCIFFAACNPLNLHACK